jgi:hypothetical protein
MTCQYAIATMAYSAQGIRRAGGICTTPTRTGYSRTVIGDYSYTAHGEASRTTPAGTTTYDYDVLGNLRYVMLVTLAGRSVTTYSTAARCVTMAYCAYCAARLASPVSPSASPNRYAHALEDSINLLGPDGPYPCDAAVDEEMLVVLASLSSGPTLPWGQGDRRRYGREAC